MKSNRKQKGKKSDLSNKVKLDTKRNRLAVIIVFSDSEMEFLSNVIGSQNGIIKSTCVAESLGFFLNTLMLKGKYVVHIKYILSKNFKYSIAKKIQVSYCKMNINCSLPCREQPSTSHMKHYFGN